MVAYGQAPSLLKIFLLRRDFKNTKHGRAGAAWWHKGLCVDKYKRQDAIKTSIHQHF
jgi:hypothetical protein